MSRKCHKGMVVRSIDETWFLIRGKEYQFDPGLKRCAGLSVDICIKYRNLCNPYF